MARSVNKVILVGNVGADPEVRTTSNGNKIAVLSLATNRVWTDNTGQRQEKTEWHRLNVFGKGAELVEQYVHKGDRLYVEGRIEYGSAGEGDARKYFTNIVVNDFIMLGRSGGDGEGTSATSGQRGSRTAGRNTPPTPPPSFPDEDDDLPF